MRICLKPCDCTVSLFCLSTATELNKLQFFRTQPRLIKKIMEDLKDVYFSPLPDSPYVKPFRFNYTQNGKRKTWDLLEVHDSVAIVVFNITRRVMVFVKQFRPAIYYNCISPEDRLEKTVDTEKYPASLGVALEMCAGIVDKDLPILEIAKEEVLEECGYDVPLSSLQRITSYRAGVGTQGALQTFYYCEVTDDMKTDQGGGVDDEIIEVVEMTIPQIEKYVNSPGPIASPPTCLFALMWFLHYKADKFRKSYEITCGECKTDELLERERHINTGLPSGGEF